MTSLSTKSPLFGSPQSPEILYSRIQFSFSTTDRPGQVPNAFGYIYSNIKNCVTWPQVQIHGPVSLSENVECIVVNARHQADTWIGSLLDLFVEQNKCNLIWMDPDDLTGVAPTPHGAFGHHLSAGSLSGSLGRRRSLGRTTTRKRRKRWRLGLNLGRTKLD